MQGDIDSIAKSVMKTPQGLKIVLGLDKFNTALSTASGKNVLELLAGPAGDVVKSAAAQAAAVPKDNGRALLSALISTKEGAALLAKIVEVIGV